MGEINDLLVRALMASERTKAEGVLNEMKGQMTPNDLVDRVIYPALKAIGDRWNDGEASLSQVYMSSRICEDFLDVLMPTECPLRKDLPRMAIVTLDDHHTLGKKIVFATMRAKGYVLLDYGTQSVEGLVNRVVKDDIEVLLVSTLMLRSALQVKELRRALNAKGVLPFLVVGGAPFIFDPSLAKEVEADAFGRDSSEAINIINNYVGGADQ